MQGSTGQILIRDVIESDYQTLTGIGRRQLGSDYISDDDFIEATEDPGEFCIVAVRDGIPLGFAICREFGPEDEAKELSLPESPQRDKVRGSRKIGLLDSVAVGEDAVGLGIGTALCEEALDRFSLDGCDLAVSMAWVHFDGPEPIAGTLTRGGFQRTELVIQGYWNMWVESEGGHQCPFCGAPCHCYAAMWIKEL